jgi:conjugation system TraG family ATPase
MHVRLEDKLPILEVAADCIVSKMGDVTIAFEVEKPEIFTIGAADYEGLHQAFVKACKVLPPGTVVHMQDEYRKEWYQAKQLPAEASLLQQASERFFAGRPRLRHRCHLYLTRRPTGRRAVSSGNSGLLRKVLVPAGVFSEENRRAFEEAAGQFSRILQDSGMMQLRRLKTAEIVSDARRAGLIEQYCQLQASETELMTRDIDLGERLRIGEYEGLLFTLADPARLPGQCTAWRTYEPYSTEQTKLPVGFAAGLGLLLDCNHLYNQYIVIGEQGATLKRLEAKGRRQQSLSRASRENAVAREATVGFLQEAVSQQRQAVKAHFNVFCWTDDPRELPELRNKVASAMAGMDAVTHVETMGAPQLWWAGIPGNAGDLPENECFDTFLEQACCFLGYETNYRGSQSGFGIRLGDRLTGYPVMVDLDIEPRQKGWTQNGNMFVLSGSGGGKSFVMNHICRSYHDQGMHIVLVDVGHSYQLLCRLLGGYYFTYDEKKPIQFNPFYVGNGEVFDTEKKESQKNLLLALWKRSDETHYRSEYVAISNALTSYYAMLGRRPEIFACFDTFYEFIQQEYVRVLADDGVKSREFDVENFLYVLRPYYKGGEFDFLLNARENLDLLGQRFIVFELDNIKDHPILFPIVTMVIVDVFLSKMRKLRGIRKMLEIEEAWKAIANAGMAANIQYWEKTMRKFQSKLVLVSQEIEDIVESPIVKQAIINNSDCKILLDQSKFQNRFDEIQELLGISDKQKAEVLSINKAHDAGRVYKDCWIALGSTQSKVYRIETSWEEYLAYTSEQGEKVKIEQYAERYGSLEKGIEALAQELRNGKQL